MALYFGIPRFGRQPGDPIVVGQWSITASSDALEIVGPKGLKVNGTLMEPGSRGGLSLKNWKVRESGDDLEFFGPGKIKVNGEALGVETLRRWTITETGDDLVFTGPGEAKLPKLALTGGNSEWALRPAGDDLRVTGNG